MRQINNVYLIGMPGCGKSTIGQEIGKRMNRVFLDLDAYIETQEETGIPELFTHGEQYFRDLESKYLRQVSAQVGMVIATGGGIVLRQENIDVMRQSGKIIFIDTAPERLIANSPLAGRPLIGDDKNRVFALYDQRYKKYCAAADIRIENNGSLDETVEQVLKICNEMYSG